MSDRELLEMAAKAAGYSVLAHIGGSVHTEQFWRGAAWGLQLEDMGWVWNPLTDDGDALRLAVRCAQRFGFYRFMRAWLIAMATEQGDASDPYAATRRAIVRAAAEIGREME